MMAIVGAAEYRQKDNGTRNGKLNANVKEQRKWDCAVFFRFLFLFFFFLLKREIYDVKVLCTQQLWKRKIIFHIFHDPFPILIFNGIANKESFDWEQAREWAFKLLISFFLHLSCMCSGEIHFACSCSCSSICDIISMGFSYDLSIGYKWDEARDIHLRSIVHFVFFPSLSQSTSIQFNSQSNEIGNKIIIPVRKIKRQKKKQHRNLFIQNTSFGMQTTSPSVLLLFGQHNLNVTHTQLDIVIVTVIVILEQFHFPIFTLLKLFVSCLAAESKGW